MTLALTEIPSGSSRWCSRLAVFGLLVILVALILHRIFGMSTAVALNLVGVGILLAAAAVVSGLVATVDIWRHGRAGAARVLFGVSLGLAILTGPLLLLVAARGYPTLNDVTTDTADPPPFRTLAAARTGMANPVSYPAASFAAVQDKAYPDLRPLDVNRPPSETFDLVVEALKRLQMTVVSEEPPTEESAVGLAEAFDRTLVIGFYDDIAVRVSPIGDGEDAGSRIDLRSSSRYGQSDFGANAQRLREIMREIVARLEATVPAAGEGPADTPNKKNVKPGKGAGREKGAGRKPRDDAPPGTRRVPERKAPPP
jgi:uncharacterized protein (DUF1499 family)